MFDAAPQPSTIVDVSELDDQALAAVVGLLGARSVSAATGLPLAYLIAVAPGANEPAEVGPKWRAHLCPGCGGLMARPARTGYERCRTCRWAIGRERVQRAHAVLDTGLRGMDATLEVQASEQISFGYAEKILTEARRERRQRAWDRDHPQEP